MDEPTYWARLPNRLSSASVASTTTPVGSVTFSDWVPVTSVVTTKPAASVCVVFGYFGASCSMTVCADRPIPVCMFVVVCLSVTLRWTLIEPPAGSANDANSPSAPKPSCVT